LQYDGRPKSFDLPIPELAVIQSAALGGERENP